jgi:hypothetical protein
VAGGPPLYASTDHFEFSGQRLIECSSTCDGEPRPSWASSGWSAYRGREERSPLRLYHKADSKTWRLHLPQGGFAEFGYPEVGAIAGADAGGVDWTRVLLQNLPRESFEIYRWKLVRLVDAASHNAWKNVVAFRWQHNDVTQRPRDVSLLTDIFYTPLPTESLAASDHYAHHVRLNYEQWRPMTYITTPPIWRRFSE